MAKKLSFPVTVAVLTKNNELTLQRALDSVSWAKEIVVIDSGSDDKSVSLAKKNDAVVFTTNTASFAVRRNIALRQSTQPWIFYLDADEVVSKSLSDSVGRLTKPGQPPAAYMVGRENYFLGTKMYPDAMERLFHKSVLRTWKGKVHEHPVLLMPARDIEGVLLHYTHTDITSMLDKTNRWSEIEAELRIAADHPPMKWWRLVRIGLTTWWQQFIVMRIGRFGRAGVFEGYFQMIDKLIVYVKLWERQQLANGKKLR